MKIPVVPQKIQEDMNDSMESFGMALEHTSNVCWELGYVAGAKKVLKLMEKGADYDDIKSEIKELEVN